MGDADITASRWRLVEVGRVVLFSAPSPYVGRIATIVEIIDHKRVLVDGPSDDEDKAVPRHAAALANVALTPIVIEKLPRAIGNGALKSAWKAAEVEKKWESGVFAQRRAQSAKRRSLNDFERFKVMRLRKQVRFEEKKALAKIRASA
ncbi:60S ribosomal protein L14-B [Trichodelitschia bisporula]|uniref:60S ribosomal protein L14-B n=1 Tax=Trichodelitschia bisporula TaxID=703511 RepID=A0A6G1I988_9PEZI|nr:60S ribosomal protein L14-B [Trichodelitschia bisporula]